MLSNIKVDKLLIQTFDTFIMTAIVQEKSNCVIVFCILQAETCLSMRDQDAVIGWQVWPRGLAGYQLGTVSWEGTFNTTLTSLLEPTGENEP